MELIADKIKQNRPVVYHVTEIDLAANDFISFFFLFLPPTTKDLDMPPPLSLGRVKFAS